MGSVVDVSKIAELQAKTDQDLLKIVGKELERGLALASIAKAKQSALHIKAEVIYTKAKALLSTISEASGHELAKLEAKVNELRTGAFSVIALLMAFFPSYTDRTGFWTLDGAAMRWVGVVVYFFGGLLRIIPVYALRNRFSGLVTIQPGHALETTGIYGASVTRATWGCLSHRLDGC